LSSFLGSRGWKLIKPRALVIRASISATNRCASDPHANSLLMRSSGSCRMFGHPRVSRSRSPRATASLSVRFRTPRKAFFMWNAERTLAYFVCYAHSTGNGGYSVASPALPRAWCAWRWCRFAFYSCWLTVRASRSEPHYRQRQRSDNCGPPEAPVRVLAAAPPWRATHALWGSNCMGKLAVRRDAIDDRRQKPRQLLNKPLAG
jgi:hypothetical protein